MKRESIFIITLLILGLSVPMSHANYKDLEKCTVNNTLAICKGTPLPKKEEVIVKTEDEILLGFFAKFIKMVNEPQEEKEAEVIVKTIYIDEDW